MIKMSNAMEVFQTIDCKMLFGIEIKEHVLNEIISNDDFPCLSLIYHINNVLAESHTDKKTINNYKNVFFHNKTTVDYLLSGLSVSINEDALFADDTSLISTFSCFNLIQRIVKYGKFKNNILCDFNEDVLSKILLLNVLETSVDEEEEEDESNKELLNLYLSIISYNQFSNDINYSNYYRLSYIFDNYIECNNEINDLFKNNCGYSIKNYLIFLQIFLILGSKSKPLIDSNIFNDTPDALEIKECIKQHIFDNSSKEELDKITIQAYIPSSILIEKPIILVNNMYLLLNPDYLLSRIHGIFFHKIKNIINNNAVFNRRFYGDIFEKYCKDICKIYADRSLFGHYEFIDSFKYKVGTNIIESSDYYLHYKDITIVFETKSTSRFVETTTNPEKGDKETAIEDEFNYKARRPLLQIESRLDEIMSLDESLYPDVPLSKIKNSSKYYYVVVSDESIINNYLMYKNYFSTLKTKYSKHIPLYLNISEYEHLLMSLYNRKRPIDIVFEHYFKQYYASNFSDMIRKEHNAFKFEKLDIFDKEPYSDETAKLFEKVK